MTKEHMAVGQMIYFHAADAMATRNDASYTDMAALASDYANDGSEPGDLGLGSHVLFGTQGDGDPVFGRLADSGGHPVITRSFEPDVVLETAELYREVFWHSNWVAGFLASKSRGHN